MHCFSQNFLEIFLHLLLTIHSWSPSSLIQRLVLSNCFEIRLRVAIQNEVSIRQQVIVDQIVKRAHLFVCIHSITQQSFYFQ